MTESPRVLIHIGYAKTGTSWLQAHFFGNPATGLQWLDKLGRDHPVRRLVAARPFDFDAERCRASFEPLLRRAEDAGLLPVVSFERLCGHPASGGHDAEVIARRLAEVFPDGRVLVFIREQRGMIVSTYKQYVKTGGPCSLRHFLQPAASPSMRVPWFDLAYFEYDRLLRSYRSLFGGDSVLAATHEQFVEDPAAVLASIGEFAGRPVLEQVLRKLPYGKRKRPSHTAATISTWRRVNRLAVRTDLHQAPLVVSGPLQRAARSLIKRAARDERLLGRRSERGEAELRRLVAEIVGDRYAESNRATSELIGVDLGAYGWMV